MVGYAFSFGMFYSLSQGPFSQACTDPEQLNRYFTYNVSSKQFEPTEYALSLERESANYTFASKTGLGTAIGVVDEDAEMASSG